MIGGQHPSQQYANHHSLVFYPPLKLPICDVNGAILKTVSTTLKVHAAFVLK